MAIHLWDLWREGRVVLLTHRVSGETLRYNQASPTSEKERYTVFICENLGREQDKVFTCKNWPKGCRRWNTREDNMKTH